MFSQKGFFAFHYEWDRIAAIHKVELPIHMKEFARPDGRLAYLSDDERRSLFADLVYLINRNKLYSMTVVVGNAEFQQYFPKYCFRGYMGSAALAFLWCMLLNHLNVKSEERMAPMAYVVARSDVNSELADCYNFWRSYEVRITAEYTGAFGIEEPRRVNALQAADMVAWANLKRHRGENFDRGFEPLELLTRYVESDVKPNVHFHFPVSGESTKKLAAILGQPNRQKGRRISLLGLISPEMREYINRPEKP